MYVLAHGCSQHVSSPSEVTSSPSLVVERVVVRATAVERTTAVFSRAVGAVKVLSWSLVAWEPLPAADLAPSVGRWVIEGIVVVDRSPHVEWMVPSTLSWRATLVEVGALLFEICATSERSPRTTIPTSRSFTLFLALLM